MRLEDFNCLGSYEKALTGVVTIQCAENLLIPKAPKHNQLSIGNYNVLLPAL